MYEKYLNKLKQSKYIAMAMLIGTMVIAFATFYDSAIKLITPFLSHPTKIIVDVKLASKDDSRVYELMDEDYYWDFFYKEIIDDNIIIKPDFEYLDAYYKDKFINVKNILYDEKYSSITAPFPILDVKVINNSKKTIVLDKISVIVISSTPDDRPLIHIVTSTGSWDGLFKIYFVNEGWGIWDSLEINFNLHKKPSTKEGFNDENQNYSYFIKIPFFEKTEKMDLSEYLAKEGVEFDSTEGNKEIKSTGPFKYKDSEYGPYCAIMEGEVILKDTENKILQNIHFSARIPLTMKDVGGGLAVFDTYNLLLQNEGSNYKIDYPISISLLPNEPERILLILKASKTSNHKFKIKLENINDVNIESKIINLEIFVPKSSN